MAAKWPPNKPLHREREREREVGGERMRKMLYM